MKLSGKGIDPVGNGPRSKPDHEIAFFCDFGDGRGEFLFAMKVRASNTFNLCPADGCVRRPATNEGGTPQVHFELYDIDPEAVAQARAIVRAARLDIGGVEFIERADGVRVFYDINASSVYRDEICEGAGVDAVGKQQAFLEREYAQEMQRHALAIGRRSRF